MPGTGPPSEDLVDRRGLEPPTSCMPCRRAPKLRHRPNLYRAATAWNLAGASLYERPTDSVNTETDRPNSTDTSIWISCAADAKVCAACPTQGASPRVGRAHAAARGAAPPATPALPWDSPAG